MMDTLTRIAKFKNVTDEELAGKVADSHEYRLALVKRVHAGEITLEYAQAELKRTKNGAKKNGQITRNQAFRQG